MNTTTQATLGTRQPEVVVAILSTDIAPYMLGALDAKRGGPFCPEEYYLWSGDMLEYTEGWEAVCGESDITRNFKADWVEREPAIEDDYEWIRKGC